MRRLPTKEQMIAFEKEIADIYNRGEIKAPVHLSGGNEDALLEIFKQIEEDDWVFSTWRSHYHCLLKGVSRDLLRRDILQGHSITLSYPLDKVFTSAIVGGIIPIALGAAWAIKRRGTTQAVHCFIGDMTATTGVYTEALRYAWGHDLPIHFYIEDNGLSVKTRTAEVWGVGKRPIQEFVSGYSYKLEWPHAGAGKWIKF